MNPEPKPTGFSWFVAILAPIVFAFVFAALFGIVYAQIPEDPIPLGPSVYTLATLQVDRRHLEVEIETTDDHVIEVDSILQNDHQGIRTCVKLDDGLRVCVDSSWPDDSHVQTCVRLANTSPICVACSGRQSAEIWACEVTP